MKNIFLKNRGSIAGIVYRKDRWITAVRKNNNAVGFYSFTRTENKEKLKPEPVGELVAVGDFQNMNLFLDEEDNIYMFGMHSTILASVTSGTHLNYCQLHKLEYSETDKGESSVTNIFSVRLDKDGYMQTGDYKPTDEKKIQFTTKLPTAFKCTSCVNLRKNKDTGIENDGSDKPDFIGNPGSGFIGKFSLYASANNVEEAPEKKEGVKYTVRKEHSYPPEIQCNIFEEDKK